jgi:uncharacterized protein (DUF433 family)
MTIIQDNKMAGEPRLEGRRITVLHVVTAVEDFGGVEAAATQLRIEPEEVIEALDYAENNPEQMDELREEHQRLADMPDLGQSPLPDRDSDDESH